MLVHEAAKSDSWSEELKDVNWTFKKQRAGRSFQIWISNFSLIAQTLLMILHSILENRQVLLF